tara:strand:- start:286 stop:612 length:327 start_codon:yes stop_codon:yes gene_type:complete
MRTITYKKTIAAATTLAEETAFSLKVQQQYGSAFVMFADCTNVTVKLQYMFTDDDGTETPCDLTTQALTTDVGTVVSFPWKAGNIRVRVSATDSTDGGTLRINASTSN